MINTDICLLKVPCIVASSLQAFTATPSKKATITAIFLASFPATFVACPHRSCCCWRFCCWVCAFSCWFPLLKANVLLLLGSLLLPTSQPLLAVLVLLVCHKLVSDTVLVGSLKMNTTLEYSTRVVQEGDCRCKKSTLNDLAYLTPLRIPLMNPVSDCNDHGHFHGPGNIKLPHFYKVAVTTVHLAPLVTCNSRVNEKWKMENYTVICKLCRTWHWTLLVWAAAASPHAASLPRPVSSGPLLPGKTILVQLWDRIQRKKWYKGSYAGVDYNFTLCQLQSRLLTHLPCATLCQSRP